jgi:hypothetical protein
MQKIVDEIKREGFAIIRGFLSPAETAEISAEVDKMYQEGLKHHATYRHGNLMFEVLNDPKAQRRVVLQAHWTAWISRFWALTSSRFHTRCIGNHPEPNTRFIAFIKMRVFAPARSKTSIISRAR